MRSRTPYFTTCPECQGTEVMYPARRERRKPVEKWSMVIPFHSRQFTVAQVEKSEWWCSRCDKKHHMEQAS